MSHTIDGSVPYDLAGRLRSQEETKAWLEKRKPPVCPKCGATSDQDCGALNMQMINSIKALQS